MVKVSQSKKIIAFLEQHSGVRFNAREIAEAITQQ